MNIRLAPHVIAGWLYGLAALSFLPFWYIWLFVAVPAKFTVGGYASDQLRYAFSRANPHFWLFVWLLVLPVLCIFMSVAYLSNTARTENSRFMLFGVGVLLGVAGFALTKVGLGIFVAVPVLWGYRAIHAT